MTEKSDQPRPSLELLRFIWSRVRPNPYGCWEWNDEITAEGYIKLIQIDGKACSLERLIVSWFVGEPEEGSTVYHICRNERCFNPAHLEALLPGQDPYEEFNRVTLQGECRRGHPQTPKNRRIYSSGGRKSQKCRLCIPIDNRESRERRKEREAKWLKSRDGEGV